MRRLTSGGGVLGGGGRAPLLGLRIIGSTHEVDETVAAHRIPRSSTSHSTP